MPSRRAVIAVLAAFALAAEPTPEQLASTCLERGQPLGAIAHLETHLHRHPDDVRAALTLGELLVRQEQWSEATRVFTDGLARLPDTADMGSLRAHAHGRLAELADRQADAYAEHLHRGIALLLQAGRDEARLCQAAGELTLAQHQRPEAARPAWHLYRVWQRLDQPAAARTALRRARRGDPSDLPLAERCALATIP